MTNKTACGNILKELRKGLRMTQTDVTVKTGIAQEMISDYEGGKKLPETANLQKLEDIYNTSLDYLLGRKDKVQSKAEINSDLAELLNNQRKYLAPNENFLTDDEIKSLKEMDAMTIEGYLHVVRFVRMILDLQDKPKDAGH